MCVLYLVTLKTYLYGIIDAVDNLPQDSIVPHISTRLFLTVVIALATLPISLAPSLSARRIRWATWISIVLYVIWLGCVSYAYADGIFETKPKVHGLWESISKDSVASLRSHLIISQPRLLLLSPHRPLLLSMLPSKAPFNP